MTQRMRWVLPADRAQRLQGVGSYLTKRCVISSTASPIQHERRRARSAFSHQTERELRMNTAAVPTDALAANPSIADDQAKYFIFCRLVTAGDTLEFAQTPRILLNHSTPSLRLRQPHIHTELISVSLLQLLGLYPFSTKFVDTYARMCSRNVAR